jgi:hypothetical protein
MPRTFLGKRTFAQLRHTEFCYYIQDVDKMGTGSLRLQ